MIQFNARKNTVVAVSNNVCVQVCKHGDVYTVTASSRNTKQVLASCSFKQRKEANALALEWSTSLLNWLEAKCA